MKYVGGTKLDERIIRTDLDPGYKEGRQWGRGRSGGQVRDEHREDFDSGKLHPAICDVTGLNFARSWWLGKESKRVCKQGHVCKHDDRPYWCFA